MSEMKEELTTKIEEQLKPITEEGSKDIIVEHLNSITESGDVTEIILDVANQIDFNWFEWAFKVGLVAVAFLFFKNLIYSTYYYLRMRFDSHVGIGAIVKFNHSIVGRVKNYSLTNIVIETTDGFTRIPLKVWNDTYWTQLKSPDLELRKLRKKNEQLELQVQTDQEQLKELTERICKLEESKPKTPGE